MGLDWCEQGDGGVCLQFVLLTHGAVLNVFLHKLCEALSPEFSSDKLVSFEITRVSSSFMIMAAGEDGVVEGALWENVDTAFICEDMVIIFPV